MLCSGKVWRLSALLLISGHLFELNAVASGSPGFCPSAFNFLVHEGTQVDEGTAKKLEGYPAGAQVFELGKGQGGGGIVYRIVPKDGSASFVIKVYRLVIDRARDLRAMKILQELAPEEELVVLAEMVPVGRRSCRIEDVRGRNLWELTRNKSLTTAEAAHVKAKWNRYVSEIEQRALAQGLKAERKSMLGVDRLIIRSSSDEPMVWLKPDNVIVEAGTGRLKLVDFF